MFLTVTLNAAIDKTLRVANLQIGRRHRCAPGDLQAGGKGINVARALRALGQPVVATGLAGGRAGDPSSVSLSLRLRELPVRVGRLKTGTPPRIDGRSIDFSALREQHSDRQGCEDRTNAHAEGLKVGMERRA